MPLTAKLLYENEKELLSSLSSGHEGALEFIYERYWECLFLSAYNVLRDKEASEDIIQEIFIRLWEKRESLTITASLRSYLFTAVHYQVFHLIKKNASKKPFLRVAQPSPNSEPDMLLYTKDLQKRISTAVENLPEKCRSIYKLSREHHLPNNQIAKDLGISSKTVENQVSIALNKLRLVLGDLMSFLL